ncbi:MAG: hypothetical protein K2P81_01585 [Bacteriovoracaceae bacterium]|nr:hypothetical protein [Bacteriovoracaceae bacterium]
MLNLFQKYRRSSTQTHKEQREQFKKYFFSEADHSWILQNAKIKETFETLVTMLPAALLTKLVQHTIAFVPSQVFQALGAHRYQMRNTVVVFPEYQRLLARGGKEAVAFLAHEVALVIYELEAEGERDPLMAEVEADKFVCDLGLADELEQLLLAMDESTEKRLRLTYLTFKSLGIN